MASRISNQLEFVIIIKNGEEGHTAHNERVDIISGFIIILFYFFLLETYINRMRMITCIQPVN